jgi:hypothetical protein
MFKSNCYYYYYYYLVIFFFCFFAHIKCYQLNDEHLLLYNTSSGVYEATLVQINSTNSTDKKQMYIHKLESVAYGEKPERFKEATLRTYSDGIHFHKKPIVCYQSVHMLSYGFFNIQGYFLIPKISIIILLRTRTIKPLIEK